jgi:hypothetical protein
LWVRWTRQISAGSIDVDIGIVAPAIAVILEDVPARNISMEPSLVPARIVNISGIVSIEPSVGIPLVEPDIT